MPDARAAQATIHVCPLSTMPELTLRVRASHLLTLVSNLDAVPTPAAIDPSRHLRLKFNDIEAPLEGYIPPAVAHAEQILAFAAAWHQEAPLVIHCWAGVSRSTAAAFITLCALDSEASEEMHAQRLRAASPTASPNRLLVRHADDLLGRSGRMVAAIEAIGRGAMTTEGVPFELPLRPAV